jgi:hypothetical protein
MTSAATRTIAIHFLLLILIPPGELKYGETLMMPLTTT